MNDTKEIEKNIILIEKNINLIKKNNDLIREMLLFDNFNEVLYFKVVLINIVNGFILGYIFFYFLNVII